MRICTWNVFWLGTPETNKIRRDARDEQDLIGIFHQANADLFVLQEVVNVPFTEELLRRARPSRRYRVQDDKGEFLTTGRMRSRVSRLQKTLLAFDETTLELISWSRLFHPRRYPGPRVPLEARFRHRNTGFEFTVIGVHLKSGNPREPAEAPESQARARECEAIARFLRHRDHDEHGQPRGPATEAVILIGDFNAVKDHPSLAAFHALVPPWAWPDPSFPDDLAGDPAEHWTSFNARTVIDHALVSPGVAARLAGPPRAIPFDLDPAFDRAPRETVHFLRRATDLIIEPDEAIGPVLAPNLFRVSDHRPLILDLHL